MTILDCESSQSALKSVCDAYHADEAQVVDWLRRINLCKEHQEDGDSGVLSECLNLLFERTFGQPARLENVYWFHFTRVPKGTDFSEGILPLYAVRDKIWNTVVSLPKDQRVRLNLKKMRRDGVKDFQYNLKTDKFHSGPYAMLIREFAFQAASIGNVDYLALPEVLEDICNGYEEEFGTSIRDEIAAGLQKCIVQFVSEKETSPHLFESALLYCWSTLNNKKISDVFAGNCDGFDAQGQMVRSEAIRKVEFLI